mmetsp:Transcript_17016/g.20991  ORF Transcript_17016/g.20991 Transcript_17016/m.20991 type:complete len:228 (+) Transcript_17016:289-972(+)
MAHEAVDAYVEEGIDQVCMLTSHEDGDVNGENRSMQMYEMKNAFLFNNRKYTEYMKSLGTDFHFVKVQEHGVVGIDYGNWGDLGDTIAELTDAKNELRKTIQASRNTVWQNGQGKKTKHHLDIALLGGRAGWLKAELQGSNAGQPGGTISQVNFPEEALETSAARDKIMAKVIQGAGEVLAEYRRTKKPAELRPAIFAYQEKGRRRRRFAAVRRVAGGFFSRFFGRK